MYKHFSILSKRPIISPFMWILINLSCKLLLPDILVAKRNTPKISKDFQRHFFFFTMILSRKNSIWICVINLRKKGTIYFIFTIQENFVISVHFIRHTELPLHFSGCRVVAVEAYLMTHSTRTLFGIILYSLGNENHLLMLTYFTLHNSSYLQQV